MAESPLEATCGMGPPEAGRHEVLLQPSAAGDGPISHAILRVARLHKMLVRRLLRQVGLHPGQELLMMYLWEAGPQRQTDLITILGSDSATMTRSVQRLEKAGFVHRQQCGNDRRVVYVEATTDSQALRREVQRLWNRVEEITTMGLTEQERAVVEVLLRRLEENLTDEFTEEERAAACPLLGRPHGDLTDEADGVC